MITSYGLATLNALLNTAALSCVILGLLAIKRGDRLTHQRCMITAFCISVVFLGSYLTRMVLFGDTRFPGQGWIRPVYFFVLISHVLLAIIIAPAVLVTVYAGWTAKYERHKRWARKVWPVWVYVLATGVLVYLLLHHWPGSP